jgi:hypothetical protein
MKTEIAKQPVPNQEQAAFKAIVYFKDGNTRTFYSFHTSYNAQEKKIIVNDQIALNKLNRLIERKFTGKYITALVYHKDTGRQIAKYCYDRLIQETPLKFYYQGSALKVFLE